MKKVLFILLLFPLSLFAQSIPAVEQDKVLNLVEGWNIIGFTCFEPIDVIEAFTPIVDKVIIVKDNGGSIYMPEFGFNGIGFFEYGYGYQIKLTEDIFNFQFCPFLVPLVEGCTDLNAINYNPLSNFDNGFCIDVLNGCTNDLSFNFDTLANTDDGSCIDVIYGCVDSLADNFNLDANTSDESCIYFGCTDSLACNYHETSNQDNGSCQYPLEEGLDCDGNPLINCFYPPDPEFVSWLQQWASGAMNGDCLDIDVASEYNFPNVISYSSISNLDGIQYFTNISVLNIQYNDVLTSLPDLSGLTNLSNLEIYNNDALTSLPELSGLTNLSFLNIYENDVLTSLPELSGLTNLSVLWIFNNYALTSLPELSGLTNLSTLDIYNNDALTSLPELSGLTNLSFLGIVNNDALSSLPDLSGLTNLSDLYIQGNDALTSLPELSGLTNLSTLYITGNDVLTILPDLSGLTNLSTLNINHNGLTSLPELSGLTNLSVLWIYNNYALTSLPDLSGLTNLSYLDINSNDALTSLGDLSGLTNLSTLNIINNDNLECVGGYPEQVPIQGSWPPVCPSACPYEAFLEYSPNAFSYDYAACITPVLMGCMDSIAENYNIQANVEDASCQYILGCMDNDADNFSQEATQEDDSCIYYGCMDSIAQNFDLTANQDDGSCIYIGCMDESADNFDVNANTDSGDCIYLGCIEPEADNFDANANQDDGSCIYLGCNNEIAENYDPQSNQDDESCIILGCTNFTAENYFTQANQDDESCIILGCIFDIFPNYNSEATQEDGSCDMNSEDVFGCTDSVSIHYNDLANTDNGSCNNSVQVGDENFGGIVFYIDSTGQRGLVAAMEDLSGTYEWGCYGTSISGADGQAIGAGYQNTLEIVSGCSETPIAASEALAHESEGYSDWYLPSLDELSEMATTIGFQSPLGNIGGISSDYYWSSSESNSGDAWDFYFDDGHSNYNYKGSTSRVRVIRAFGYTQGCMDSLACNFNPEANMADGSCEYAEQGYDCEGNITYLVGMEAEGGIVFYVDETGQHGLVAAIQNSDILYEWGCDNIDVEGADGTAIGTGYQNTLNIVNQGCTTQNGDITAAQAAFDAEISGYTDWFLPSIDELSSIYDNIGNGSQNDNIWYKSSTESSITQAWTVHFTDGNEVDWDQKTNTNRVCFVRAFGNWTMGCMDSLACNYNPEANMADGSCEYVELGYDCDGNFVEYLVGMEAEGGIVFYIDETGEHGLVSAMEDIEGTYEWGCNGTELSGADGTSIGTGYQNTLGIVAECSESPIAASEALAYESGGYSDWYLPSKYELDEMYTTIGNGGSEGNIGSFSSSDYWSSSESDSNFAWFVYFANDGYTNSGNKAAALRVRVIRAF